MKIQFIENLRTEFHRLWSIRVAVFLIGLNLAMASLSSLSGAIDPVLFFIINVVGNTTLIVARVLKQPGADPNSPPSLEEASQ